MRKFLLRVPNVIIYFAKIDSILVKGTAAWLKMAGGRRDRHLREMSKYQVPLSGGMWTPLIPRSVRRSAPWLVACAWRLTPWVKNGWLLILLFVIQNYTAGG